MADKGSATTIFWVIFLLIVAGVAAYILYPVKKELHQKQQKLQAAQGELHKLRKEQNQKLQLNHDLKTSPAAIEKVAREEFKMVRSDEAVIYYPKDAQKKWQERRDAEKKLQPEQ